MSYEAVKRFKENLQEIVTITKLKTPNPLEPRPEKSLALSPQIQQAYVKRIPSYKSFLKPYPVSKVSLKMLRKVEFHTQSPVISVNSILTQNQRPSNKKVNLFPIASMRESHKLRSITVRKQPLWLTSKKISLLTPIKSRTPEI